MSTAKERTCQKCGTGISGVAVYESGPVAYHQHCWRGSAPPPPDPTSDEAEQLRVQHLQAQRSANDWMETADKAQRENNVLRAQLADVTRERDMAREACRLANIDYAGKVHDLAAAKAEIERLQNERAAEAARNREGTRLLDPVAARLRDELDAAKAEIERLKDEVLEVRTIHALDKSVILGLFAERDAWKAERASLSARVAELERERDEARTREESAVESGNNYFELMVTILDECEKRDADLTARVQAAEAGAAAMREAMVRQETVTDSPGYTCRCLDCGAVGLPPMHPARCSLSNTAGARLLDELTALRGRWKTASEAIANELDDMAAYADSVGPACTILDWVNGIRTALATPSPAPDGGDAGKPDSEEK